MRQQSQRKAGVHTFEDVVSEQARHHRAVIIDGTQYCEHRRTYTQYIPNTCAYIYGIIQVVECSTMCELTYIIN